MRPNNFFSFFIFFAFLSAFARGDDPSLSIAFLDNCTGRPTAVRSEAGVSLALSFKDLDPTLSLTVAIEIAPPRDVLGHSAIKLAAENQAVERDGTFNLQRPITLPSEEMLRSKKWPRIWKATIRWDQEQHAELSGTGQNTIYLARPDETNFFQIINSQRDSYVCQWESEPRIISQYESNPSSQNKEVGLELPFVDVEANSGIEIEAQPAVPEAAERGPLLTSLEKNRFRGWLMPSWFEAQGTEDASKATKKITLPQGRGGVFVKHILHNRFLSQQYSLRRPGKASPDECSSWQIKEVGWLDVSLPRYEFVYIPVEKSNQQKEQLDIIKKERKSLNTCVSDTTDWLPRNELRRLVPSTRGDLAMYFYPVSSIDADQVGQEMLSSYRARATEVIEKIESIFDGTYRSLLIEQLKKEVKFFKPNQPNYFPSALRAMLYHPKFDPNLYDDRGYNLLILTAASSDENSFRALLRHPSIKLDYYIPEIPKKLEQDRVDVTGYSTLWILLILAQATEDYRFYAAFVQDPRVDPKFIQGLLHRSLDRDDLNLFAPLAAIKNLKLDLGEPKYPPAIFIYYKWKYADEPPALLPHVLRVEGALNQQSSEKWSLAHHASYSLARAIEVAVNEKSEDLPKASDDPRLGYQWHGTHLRLAAAADSYVFAQPGLDLTLKNDRQQTPLSLLADELTLTLKAFAARTKTDQARIRLLIRYNLGSKGIALIYRLVKMQDRNLLPDMTDLLGPEGESP